MTRDEMIEDIASLSALIGMGGPTWKHPALMNARTRLRADLASMDGPADGFTRLRIGIDRSGDCLVTFLVSEDEYVDGYTIAVVTADIPTPRVAEVTGKVEP